MYDELSAAGYGAYVRFDLGMVHQIDYYTGVVFRGYADGAGNAVLSGGRYDGLTAAFGRSAPATGFAVDADAVAGCLPPEESPRLELLVHFEAGQLSWALSALEGAAGGRRELSPCGTLEETMALARERGAAGVLTLENGAERLVRL